MKGYFSRGTIINWKQYRSKTEALSVPRKGTVWEDAPTFPDVPGSHVWVIPDEKFPGENSAIAVRVYRSGPGQGRAEVHEDSPAYSQYSLRSITEVHGK